MNDILHVESNNSQLDSQMTQGENQITPSWAKELGDSVTMTIPWT